jgi:hypothetical protein
MPWQHRPLTCVLLPLYLLGGPCLCEPAAKRQWSIAWGRRASGTPRPTFAKPLGAAKRRGQPHTHSIDIPSVAIPSLLLPFLFPLRPGGAHECSHAVERRSPPGDPSATRGKRDNITHRPGRGGGAPLPRSYPRPHSNSLHARRTQGPESPSPFPAGGRVGVPGEGGPPWHLRCSTQRAAARLPSEPFPVVSFALLPSIRLRCSPFPLPQSGSGK